MSLAKFTFSGWWQLTLSTCDGEQRCYQLDLCQQFLSSLRCYSFTTSKGKYHLASSSDNHTLILWNILGNSSPILEASILASISTISYYSLLGSNKGEFLFKRFTMCPTFKSWGHLILGCGIYVKGKCTDSQNFSKAVIWWVAKGAFARGSACSHYTLTTGGNVSTVV